VEKIKKLNIEYVMFSICSPFPATEFYAKCKENNWLKKDIEDMDALRTSLAGYPHLSADDLEELISWAYKSYYLRPSYIAKRLRKMESWADFRNNLRSAMNLFT